MQLPAFTFFADHGAIIGLVLLVALLVAFAMERRPPVVIALVGGIGMMAMGYLQPTELLRVFGNPAPVAIGAMFVLSGALLRTGAMEELSGLIIRRTLRRPRLAIAEIGAGTLFASAFMNNTPVVMVMIPIMKRLARVLNISATRILIPLSYLSILGGTLTLIGTSTNLLVNGVAQQEGQAPFGIFEITGVGLIGALAGILTLLLGRALLPDRPEHGLEEQAENDSYLSQLVLQPTSDLVGQTLGKTALFRRPGVRVLAVRRGGELERGDIEGWKLVGGDLLVVAASPAELASLAEAFDFRVGLTGVGGEIATAGADRPADLRLVQALISPTHPIIGRRLAEIPMLSRLKVRVLGLARPRHLAGPDLPSARVRAGDRLLIAAGSDAISSLQANVGLADVGAAQAKAFRRRHAPLAVAAMAAVVLGAALLGLAIEALAIAAVGFVLLTRCIEPEEAWSSIDGNTLVLIYGMLAFGMGLMNAGTVH